MKTTITREFTQTKDYEIEVPSYYKADYQNFRIYLDGERFKCCAINNWGDRVEFHHEYSISCVDFDRPSTQDEFIAALDKVYAKIEFQLNDMLPKEGSMYIVTPTLVPIEPVKEN